MFNSKFSSKYHFYRLWLDQYSNRLSHTICECANTLNHYTNETEIDVICRRDWLIKCSILRSPLRHFESANDLMFMLRRVFIYILPRNSCRLPYCKPIFAISNKFEGANKRQKTAWLIYLFIYLFIYLCFKIFEYNSLTSNCCILKNMAICIKNLSSVQVLSTPPRQYWCLLRNHGFWYCGCILCLL